MSEGKPVVGIIMGSQSDWSTMRHAAEMLEKLNIACEARVTSAHRTPDRLHAYVSTAKDRGLKVIIADGECMLARQRRIRAEEADKLKRGERVMRARYGVDDEICTGDHSCIRLSGCPSLTVKPSPDPLRTDPVASVIESCVGCGLCGEVAEAAVLCPSFYRAEIIYNPTGFDRFRASLRKAVIGWLQRRRARRRIAFA